MIFFPKPQDGLLIAVNKAFNTVKAPVFSDFRLEDGHVTLKVEYENKVFEAPDMLEHIHDVQLRHLSKFPDYPYKFQGFEDSECGRSFRITSGELKNWRDLAQAAAQSKFKVAATEGTAEFQGNTSVTLDLVETLKEACETLEQFKDANMSDYLAAKEKPVLQHTGWRYD